jgi:hypothetical protein
MVTVLRRWWWRDALRCAAVTQATGARIDVPRIIKGLQG